MKKEAKSKKSAKKATSAPVKKSAPAKKPAPAKKKQPPAKKPAKKAVAKPITLKTAAPKSTGAQVADLLKNTLIKPAAAPVVETVKLEAPKKPEVTTSGTTLNAKNFRPAGKPVPIIRPFSRLRAAGI